MFYRAEKIGEGLKYYSKKLMAHEEEQQHWAENNTQVRETPNIHLKP